MHVNASTSQAGILAKAPAAAAASQRCYPASTGCWLPFLFGCAGSMRATAWRIGCA